MKTRYVVVTQTGNTTVYRSMSESEYLSRYGAEEEDWAVWALVAVVAVVALVLP
jgi:hypothetical protein